MISFTARIFILVIITTIVTIVLYTSGTKIKRHTRHDEKYLAFLFNAARLGNQMFRIISGYSIAKRLGRKLFFSLNGHGDEARVRVLLAKITEAFPRTFQAYTVLSPCIEPTVVPFFNDSSGRRTCCAYVDPMRYSKHCAKFLVLDTEYGQNIRFFENNLPEIRELLTFGYKVKEKGQEIVCEYEESGRLHPLVNDDLTLVYYDASTAGAVCVHIRRTDFILFNAASDFNQTLEATLQIAKQHNLKRFLIFGDDKIFMNYLAGNITKYQSVVGDLIAQVSDFGEIEEFYISSRVCTAFLISAPMSTFGWWLAFFASNQDAVYYINDSRPLMLKKPSNELFLRSWKPYPL